MLKWEFRNAALKIAVATWDFESEICFSFLFRLFIADKPLLWTELEADTARTKSMWKADTPDGDDTIFMAAAVSEWVSFIIYYYLFVERISFECVVRRATRVQVSRIRTVSVFVAIRYDLCACIVYCVSREPAAANHCILLIFFISSESRTHSILLFWLLAKHKRKGRRKSNVQYLRFGFQFPDRNACSMVCAFKYQFHANWILSQHWVSADSGKFWFHGGVALYRYIAGHRLSIVIIIMIGMRHVCHPSPVQFIYANENVVHDDANR